MNCSENILEHVLDNFHEFYTKSLPSDEFIYLHYDNLCALIKEDIEKTFQINPEELMLIAEELQSVIDMKWREKHEQNFV